MVQAATLRRKVAIKESRLFDKIDQDTRIGKRCSPQGPRNFSSADGHDKVKVGRGEGNSAGAGRRVERKNEGALMAAAGQRSGERPGHVAQAPGLCEGH